MMDEDELDPRIQVELEKLNSATDVINKLEIELDEANTTFRMLLNECTRRLKVHSSKHGSAIENARPYYEALDIARQAQQDCQQAAVSFQRANGMYRKVHEAAKETVALAESRFMSQQPEWRFDSAWQEMLNHATIKVRDAEKQRAESSAHHGRATARYKEAQDKVHALEQRLRRNVAKSRPYFEEKARCNDQLSAQKEAVEGLAGRVARVKSEYAESLRRLEGISEEIHRRRGEAARMGGCGVREPGVGAELEYAGEQENCNVNREPASEKPAGIEGGDRVKGVEGDVQTSTRISFDSLHGSHFNPGRRLREEEVDEYSETEDDGEENVDTDVSADLLHGFSFPPTECISVASRPEEMEDLKAGMEGVSLAGGSGGDRGDGGGSVDSEPGEARSGRQPDLEISFHLDKTRREKDSDRDAALELPTNTWDSVITAELRDVSN